MSNLINTNKAQALKWWESLSLTERQNYVFYYCTGHEIGSMEFTEDHIVEIWESTIEEY
jgi:hypothetical protein